MTTMPTEGAIRVRRALEDEAALLTGIARASKASWGYPGSWLHEWKDALTLSTAYIARHTVLVAESGGAVVGLVALEDDGGHAELAHLWVLPGWQGRGVGRALVARVRRLALERGWDALRVESDPNAEEFYRRLGAVAVDEVSAPVAGRPRTLPVLSLPTGDG